MPRKKKEKKLYHQPYDDFKAFLTKNRVKLREIAELLNCTVQTISLKNNGYSEYSMTEIDKICTYFNISSEIFRGQKVS